MSRGVLGRLAALAEEATCAVCIVGHLNKAPSKDAYLRVANSVAFWNASRSVVLVHRRPARPGRAPADRAEEEQLVADARGRASQTRERDPPRHARR